MMEWRNAPDRGWVIFGDLGPNIVGATRSVGEAAGLRQGDEILAIDGIPYSTVDELLRLLDVPIGHRTVYTIKRNEAVLEIPVEIQPLGIWQVVRQSGVFWLVGLIFVGMGVVVFGMKPFHATSWAFVIMVVLLGVYITYAASSYFLSPKELDLVVIVSLSLLPSAIIHLALLFPEARLTSFQRKWFLGVLYFCSLSFLGVVLGSSHQYAKLPSNFLMAMNLYLFVSIMVLLGSSVLSYVKASSIAVRLQALVVCSGIFLAFLIPVIENLANVLFRFSLVPDPILFFLIFLLFFPLSIAYAIIQHDLFEVDVIVRRTYGYVLSTMTVLGLYGLLAGSVNAIFQSSQVSRSPVFTILFALGVVFVFSPLHRNIQSFVDKSFYRRQYDYRQTIKEVSETMTTMLDETVIREALIGSATKEMYLENGFFLIPTSGKYRVVTAHGDETHSFQESTLDEEDLLVGHLTSTQQAIFRHEVELNPKFEQERDLLLSRFDQFQSELMLSVNYKDEVKGIVSLGRKKSGKMFTLEDLDLLRTMISQGAIALENAQLVAQMKRDLTIRNNLSRYLSPQIVDSIIKNNVSLDLGGERKVVTVLFSDIRNFTTISETMPPDRLVRILNEYFTEMAQIIFDNKGSLDKYIGDAIVAVFGSLIPVGNSALQAVRAAREMIQRLPALNAKWQEECSFSMDIGIGVNTGDVFLGNIGSPERMEFTVIGDTVNVASRFSGLANGGEILFTRATMDALGRAIPYQELPPATVKGKAQPLEVFQVSKVLV